MSIGFEPETKPKSAFLLPAGDYAIYVARWKRRGNEYIANAGWYPQTVKNTAVNLSGSPFGHCV